MLLLLLACAGKPEPADSGAPPCEPQVWTLDLDGDGWAGSATVEACDAPAHAEEQLGDCDDEEPSVHPGAEELCDGVDNDCDGVLDPPRTAWYADADGDGFGDPSVMVTACAWAEGTVADNTDCDDGRADVHPAAEEVWYDGVDQDCLGDSDFDADGDGHDAPTLGGDCRDDDPATHPDAEEVCFNGIDDNCDGSSPECDLDPLLHGSDGDIVMEDGSLTPFAFYGVSIAFSEALTPSGRPVLAVSQLDVGDGSESIKIYSYDDGSLMEESSIVSADDWDLGGLIHTPEDWNEDGHLDLAMFAGNAPEGGYLNGCRSRRTTLSTSNINTLHNYCTRQSATHRLDSLFRHTESPESSP